jgi:GAF domain-containing protein
VTAAGSPGGAGASVDPALAAALEALRRPASEGAAPARLLHEALRAARELLTADGAGVLLVDAGGALRSAGARDQRGRRLEKAQERAGEGPCVDAFVTGATTLTRDIASDPRWPELRPLMADAGIGSVVGVPLRLDGTAVGSLDLYTVAARDWTGREVARAEAFAGVLGTGLAAAAELHHRGELVDQLETALRTHVVIERAIGLVMAREGCDAAAAFGRLRATARARRRRVVEVARELLDRHEASAGDPAGS